jgi:hypothetical protein
MWIALLILILVLGTAGVIARSRFESKKKEESNPADAFDITEDV